MDAWVVRGIARADLDAMLQRCPMRAGDGGCKRGVDAGTTFHRSRPRELRNVLTERVNAPPRPSNERRRDAVVLQVPESRRA